MTRRRRCLRMESLEHRHLLDGTPIISEFLAINSTGLQDDDGEYSDWIEIHNPTASALSLNGWYLTDDADELTQWQFPDVTIEPLGYLTVFASGNDRIDVSAPLHTSFRLSGSGEYLGLIQPDGSTVAYDFGPSFPPQIEDLSYGALSSLAATPLLQQGAAARALVPSSDALGNNWIAPEFNDAAWLSGTTGVGFDREDQSTSDIGLDLESAMHGVNSTAYVRVPFDIASADQLVLDQLALDLKYDDGFAAYLNGQPLLNRNVPGGGESPSSGLMAYYSFDGNLNDNAANFTNNSGVADNNLTSIGGTSTTYATGQVGQAIRLGDTASDPVRLTSPNHPDFNLGGTFAVEAWIYPTEVVGWGRIALLWDGSGKNSIHFAMRNGTQLSLFHVDESGVQTSIESPFNTIDLGANVGWQHVAVVGDGATLRLYHNGEEVSAGSGGVQAVPTPTPYAGTTRTTTANLGIGDSAGTPTAANIYKGLMDEVAFWNVALTPAQIASHFQAANAGYGLLPIGGSTSLTWNSAAVTERPEDEDGIEFDRFDITEHADLLHTGTNVLALQGLNSSASDDDFLVLPEIHALRNVLQPDTVGYFGEPTPGAPNAQNFLGLVADIDFSVERGYFDAPFELAIATDTPGVSIRYTTDGSVPTETRGATYSGPVTVSSTSTIRAAAFRDGYRPSDVVTNTYIFLDDVLTQPNTAPAGSHWDTAMDPNVVNLAQTHTVREGLVALPTLSISMHPDDLFGTNGIYRNSEARGEAWIRPGSVEFFYPDEYAGYRADDGFTTTAGVRIAGIFSRLTSNPKHSLRLSFRDEFGPSKLEFPLFEGSPVTRFDNLVVLNGHNQSWATGISNALYLRDQVARDLQALTPDAAHVHGMFVNLYLNGQYWGQYNLIERPDDSFAAENFGGNKDEYDVLKGVRFGETPLARLVSGTRDAWEEMFAIADRDMTDPVNYAAIQEFVDIDQLIDYNIGILYTGDRDGPTGIVAGQSTPKNFYALRRRTDDGRFQFFAWDAEFTFEDANVDVSERQGSQNPARLHYQLRANPEYRLRFADHVHRWFFNEGPMTAENIADKFAARASEIDQSIVAESARWGDSKREPPYRRDIEWINELNRVLNSVIPARHNVVLNQFVADGLYPTVAAPEFAVNGQDQHGGMVTDADGISLDAPAGAIYYTLDGTDPRVGAASVDSLVAVNSSSPATALVPRSSALGETWKLPSFNDSAWTSGTASVGFDRSGEYAGLLGVDLLSPAIPAAQRIDSDGNGTNDNNSVFVRVPFDLEDPTRYDSLRLDMTYDDGFVAYLNGQEVARGNAPAEEEWNSSAIDSRGGTSQVMIAIAYGADNSITIYRNGEVYAPANNASLGTLQTYAAGVANVLLGVRHEDISGGSGSATGNDAFWAGSVNEARIYDASLSLTDIQQLAANGPLPTDQSLPGDTRLKHLWTFNSNANDLIGAAEGTLRNGASLEGGRLVLDGVNDFMSSAPINNTITAKTLVAWVSLDNLEQQSGGVLTIGNSAGTDVFDSIVYGERTARQWMAGSNFFDRTVVNNTGPAETAAGNEVFVPATFDISEFAHLLQSGENVLAIHAMTHATNAQGMLVTPTLRLSETTSTGLSPTAQLYSGDIILDQSTRIKARVLSSGEWSALTEAVFTVPIEGLRISEVMYHPAAPAAPSSFIDEDFEFIELFNAGSQPISLTQLQFVDGIEFDFAQSSIDQLVPGGHALVVSNQAAFTARYGQLPEIAGEYTGQLANGGETVVLADAFGTRLIELTYQDNWYSHTDGEGFSLTLRDPAADQTVSDTDAVWRPSTRTGGSPGTGDVSPLPGDIRVNEIFSHPVITLNGAWLELKNTTNHPVDVGHWYVSDSADQRRKYQIAADTIIPAGGFLVLRETTNFGLGAPDPGRLIPWQLAPAGGTIYLTAADATGELLGFREDRGYDAAEPDVSLGIYTKSTGAVDFVRLQTASLGATNAAPIVGPIVINEIMYHPETGENEYIELHNITNQTVTLDDGQGHGWRLRGAIEFLLPAGHSIAPGGYALVIQADDAADPAVVASEFRATHNVPAGVEIFVYTDLLHGSLSNNGEKLYLERPEPAISAVSPPYLVIDAVNYSDRVPWPEIADGQGASLSRFVSTDYGNDVENWMAGAIGGTPGQVNVGIDTTAPSVPTGVQGSILSGTEVWLTWDFSHDPQTGVELYRVYRDGTLVGTTPIPAYRDAVTFLTSPFQYTVTAVNSDGFESAPSEQVSIGGTLVRLRDGENGYSGTRDATIRQQSPAVPVGTTESVIEVDGEDGGFEKYGLLRWDLAGVTSDATILSASVTLQVVDPTGGVYGVYDVRRNWVESEVTWNQAAAGVAWSVAGAAGAADRGATSLASWSGGTGEQTLAFNEAGLDLIRQWIAGTLPNYGIIVADSDVTDGFDFQSREATSVQQRPALNLVLIETPLVPQAGDINRDAVVDARDIDLLQAAVRTGSSELLFDLDGNGVVSAGDVTYLVETLLGTTAGDANLDGVVDARDFNVWNAHKFRNISAGWADGDFTGDRRADASDFNLWFANRFRSGAAQSAALRVPRAPQLDRSPVVTDTALRSLSSYRTQQSNQLRRELTVLHDTALADLRW